MPDKRINESNNTGGEQDREEMRREAEQAEQQGLDQGMDTGTHDSTRHGVDWGRSYRGKKAGSPDKSAKQKGNADSK